MDYQALFDKNWDELEKISLTVEKVTKFLDVLAEYHEDADSFDLMVAGISVNLQSVCMGAERLLANVANDIDGYMPTGDRWQQKLFAQMAIALPAKRPPVIRTDTAQFLTELKGFKVSVRGGFGDTLDSPKVIAMAMCLPDRYEWLKRDCLLFHHELQHPMADSLSIQSPDFNKTRQLVS